MRDAEPFLHSRGGGRKRHCELNVNVVVACAAGRIGVQQSGSGGFDAALYCRGHAGPAQAGNARTGFRALFGGAEAVLGGNGKKADVPLVGQQQPMLIDTSLLPIVLAP